MSFFKKVVRIPVQAVPQGNFTPPERWGGLVGKDQLCCQTPWVQILALPQISSVILVKLSR